MAVNIPILLTEDNEQINQPPYINIKLMNHQKTIIKRMLDLEIDRTIKIPELDIGTYYRSEKIKDAIIKTNIAILGDKVGAGKTLDIVSLISIKPVIEFRETQLMTGKYISLSGDREHTKINTNLVIVPHKLIPQWKTNFEKASNLKVLTITMNKQINELLLKKIIKVKSWNGAEVDRELWYLDTEKLKNVNVILVGDTMYKRIVEYSNYIIWNRCIIDEADTIKLCKMMEDCLNFNFLWLITGTPTGICRRSPFYKEIFITSRHLEIKHLIIKNDDKYIESSIILPDPNMICIRCLTPKELNIVKNFISPSILQMINAGNTDEAIKALNCNVDTNENIFQVITKNIVENIKNKKIEIDAEKMMVYNKEEKDKKISFLENQLIKLETKYEDIKKSIYELNNDYCPVCLDAYTKPVLVSCCNKCFCFDCLAVSLGELHNNRCPHCRQNISSNDLHIISENESKKSKQNANELKDKLDVLIDIIQKKKDGSFLLFANYTETFSKIEKKFVDVGITYHILKGQSSSISKHINDYENKKVQVIMLNAQYFGAGMNLQTTTDLIIYHRFSNEMEEQIIGRAQRYGRKGTLNVYYLLHDNENNSIKANFKFNNITDVNYEDFILQNNNSNIDKIDVAGVSDKNIVNDNQLIGLDDFEEVL
jgi:DNA-binding protein